MAPIIIRITSNYETMKRRSLFGGLYRLISKFFKDRYDVTLSYYDNALTTRDSVPTYAKVTLTSISVEIFPMLSELLNGKFVPFTDGDDTFQMKYYVE